MTYATILVSLEAGRSDKHVLEAANAVAERFQADVIGITACMPIQILYDDGYTYGDIFELDSKESAREIARTEAEFRDAMGHRFRSGGRRSSTRPCPNISRAKRTRPTSS